VTLYVKGIRKPDGTTVELEVPDSSEGGLGSKVEFIRFDFTFETPDLENGVTVYTPTIGEILKDLWFVPEEVWDSGKADVGQYLSGNYGLFGWVTGEVDLSKPKNTFDGGPMLITDDSWIFSKSGGVPAVFTDESPLKLVVSNTGKPGGPVGHASVGKTTLCLEILK